MKINFIALASFILCILTIAHAQTVEIPEGQRKPFIPIDSNELIARYPTGKKWQSMAVLRIKGSGSCENWGFKGQINFAQVNRYHTQVTVLDNTKFGQTQIIRLRIDILDAASSKIITNERLKWAGFGSSDPLFDYALEKGVETGRLVSPAFRIVVDVARKWEQVDPKFERTLTEISRRIGVPVDGSAKPKELDWHENARAYSGCSFEIEWTNGFGPTKATQVASIGGKTQKITVDDLRSWLAGADPLAELYLFPSLRKRIGDRWDLDPALANAIFSGDASTESSGKVSIRYTKDDTFGGTQTRLLTIESGNVQVVRKEARQRTIYAINSMQGQMQVDHRDGMLMMSNGSGQISYTRLSADHFLFKAEINRDMTSEWRYEAILK